MILTKIATRTLIPSTHLLYLYRRVVPSPRQSSRTRNPPCGSADLFPHFSLLLTPPSRNAERHSIPPPSVDVAHEFDFSFATIVLR